MYNVLTPTQSNIKNAEASPPAHIKILVDDKFFWARSKRTRTNSIGRGSMSLRSRRRTPKMLAGLNERREARIPVVNVINRHPDAYVSL
jgi:hypothetical protein